MPPKNGPCPFAKSRGCICAKCAEAYKQWGCCMEHEDLYCRSDPDDEPPQFMSINGFSTSCPDFKLKEDTENAE